MQNITVIKYGGHAMDHADLAAAFANDIEHLATSGQRFVIVHGGGPHISALLTRLSIESHFVQGLRVTDQATMEAVEMALCGTVNKAVVAMLLKANVRAIGLSGRDAGLLMAEQKDEALGLVGSVTAVHPEILSTLLAAAWVPVIAPVANSSAYTPLNVNADTAAGAIAGVLSAERFVLLSDVPGVLDADKTLLPMLTCAECDELIRTGVITAGMIPKVAACKHALAAGAKEALILDGRHNNSLSRYVQNNEALGTLIRP